MITEEELQKYEETGKYAERSSWHGHCAGKAVIELVAEVRRLTARVAELEMDAHRAELHAVVLATEYPRDECTQ